LSASEDAEVSEQGLQPRDALAGGADVAALAAELAALRGKAIVGGKDDCAAAKELRLAAGQRLQDGPADAAVADIEGEVEVARGIRACGVHGRRLEELWIQDKVR
jgi:hypothetical protein